MLKTISISVPFGDDKSELNQDIEKLYETSKGTIQAIGNFANIDKRNIKLLVDGIIKIQEKNTYVSDNKTLKTIDILTALYLRAYPQTDIKNDKAFNRFYACYRNCKTYHYGSSGKKSKSRSSAGKTIKRDDVISFMKGLSSMDYNNILKAIRTARK